MKPNMIASRKNLAAFLGVNALLFLQGMAMRATPSHQTATTPIAHPHMVPIYVSLILIELLMFRLVWGGVSKMAPGRFWETVGCRPKLNLMLLVDVMVALGLCAVWLSILYTVNRVSADPHQSHPISPYLPQSPLEVGCWFALSACAGFCEEIAYRGYLQKQLEALIGVRFVALIVQALVFALAHSYQGIVSMGLVFVFALLLGTATLWRKGLQSSILAHACSDIYVGYLQRFF